MKYDIEFYDDKKKEWAVHLLKDGLTLCQADSQMYELDHFSNKLQRRIVDNIERKIISLGVHHVDRHKYGPRSLKGLNVENIYRIEEFENCRWSVIESNLTLEDAWIKMEKLDLSKSKKQRVVVNQNTFEKMHYGKHHHKFVSPQVNLKNIPAIYDLHNRLITMQQLKRRHDDKTVVRAALVLNYKNGSNNTCQLSIDNEVLHKILDSEIKTVVSELQKYGVVIENHPK